MEILEKIIQLDKYFKIPHESSFEILQGNIPIIVSAPHSVTQTRDGKIKCAESITGAITKLLNEELSCYSIYKTKNCNDDANRDEKSLYKQSILELVNNNNIKLIIDLHQLSPTREMDICFCTANYSNISKDNLNIFINEFSQNVEYITIDNPYKGSSPTTIASYIHNHTGITTIQIEINSNLLYPEYDKYKVDKVYISLKNSIRKYLEKINEKGN